MFFNKLKGSPLTSKSQLHRHKYNLALLPSRKKWNVKINWHQNIFLFLYILSSDAA